MAKFSIKIDSKGFARDFKKAVLEAADSAVRARADELQKLVNRVASTHRGRPVSEIKSALRAGWRRVTRDGDLTDPELTRLATAIHDGTRVNIRYDGLK